jgi:hypothetical protein
MDVESPKWEFDYNLFPVNPQWNFTLINGAAPDPTQLCPVNSDDVSKWNASSTCTSQAIYLNQATGWNKLQCWIHGRAIQGHMNWFPVTYHGTLTWDSHSPPGGDDDYNFSMTSVERSLYTANFDLIHTEFDSDETVDNWDGTDTWWEKFHDAVDDGDDAAHAMLPGNETIVIALLGLDGGHSDFKSELHPVYGMFVRVQDNPPGDPSDDHWAFFIRNWGDEGSCSNSQEYINYATLFVELPRDQAQHVDLTSQNIWAINFADQNGVKISYQKTGAGVLFAFQFDRPQSKETYVGDLHLKWSGTSLPVRELSSLSALSVSLAEHESEAAPQAILDKFNRLTPESKRKLMHELRVLDDRTKPRMKIAPTRDIASADLETARRRMAELHSARRMPSYRRLILSEFDPTIYERKKRKLDLVTTLLDRH